jgi:hypothetical protein
MARNGKSESNSSTPVPHNGSAIVRQTSIERLREPIRALSEKDQLRLWNSLCETGAPICWPYIRLLELYKGVQKRVKKKDLTNEEWQLIEDRAMSVSWAQIARKKSKPDANRLEQEMVKDGLRKQYKRAIKFLCENYGLTSLEVVQHPSSQKFVVLCFNTAPSRIRSPHFQMKLFLGWTSLPDMEFNSGQVVSRKLSSELLHPVDN